MEKVTLNQKGQALVSEDKMEEVLFYLKKSSAEIIRLIEEIQSFDLSKLTQRRLENVVKAGLQSPFQNLAMVTDEMRFKKDVLHYLVPQ